MRLTLSILIALQAHACLGQKMQGVYVGEVITQKNVLVVSSMGSKLSGHVYISEYEKFEFLGNLLADSVKGVILVPAGSEVILLGRLHKDSIEATIMSIGESKRATLKQVSSKTTKDLRRFFLDQPTERDSLLIGKWNRLKFILPDGSVDDSPYFYHYLADGEMKYDIQSLKMRMEQIWAKVAIQAGSSKKLQWNERLLPKYTWETRGQKLITTVHSDIALPAPVQEYTYAIVNDTLTITNFKGGRQIFVRDKTK